MNIEVRTMGWGTYQSTLFSSQQNPPINSDPAGIAFYLSSSRFLGFAQRLGAGGATQLLPLGLSESFMQMTGIPFGTTDWSSIEPTHHKGETGAAVWRTCTFGPIRVRMVEYTPGYSADHWCTKGHILLCLEGELHTELEDGRRFILKPGMNYQVADDAEPHRSSTSTGAKLFIID